MFIWSLSLYTADGKYLAVITKNGLWIKNKIDSKIIIAILSLLMVTIYMTVSLLSLMKISML